MSTSGRSGALLVVVGALFASVLSAASSPAGQGGIAAPPPPVVAEAPDAASAVQAARLQGSRVEVVDERTSTRTVFANPDGTQTATVTAVPVRVKQGNVWKTIDTTLTERTDGRVAPKANEGDVSFSGGGSAALASLRHEGRSLSVYWPGELPKPELSGNSATYREVLPGADLVMRAERSGLRQHLVVKTAEAAKNPALASIRMGMRADGLRVSVDDAGGLHAVDEAGTEVFSAPPSVMWDAAGRSTGIGVSVVDGGLVLAPDLEFLADPAVVYPVTIDPQFHPFGRHAWATVLSGLPRSSFWWRSADGEHPDWAQVGQCHRGPPNRCAGIDEAWAYFQFDTGFLIDKTVLEGPIFNTTVMHSPKCEGRPHALWEAPRAIHPGTTWEDRPQWRWIADFDAPKNYSGCNGAVGVGIHVGGHYSPSNLSVYYLRAVSGTDQMAWRKYNPVETKLTVVYNRRPNPPTNLRTDPLLPTPCKWCGGKSYFGDANIRLIGQLSDPEQGDMVDSRWHIYRDGVLDEPNSHWQKRFLTNPAAHSFNAVDLPHGKTVRWHLQGGDGAAEGEWREGPTFVVDRTGVSAEPKVDSAEYPSDNAWHGGTSSPGVFTFNPGATCVPQNDVVGVCDIDRYIYSWQDPPSGSQSVDADALGGKASVTLTPPGDGPRTLHVQSVDRAGHRSTKTAHYRFYVRAGNGPRSQWSLESNTTDTAFLGDRHGTLHGSATYGPGAVGTGLVFDGAAGSDMTAPSPVRTDASFSVATWVRLNPGRADDGWYPVISQHGNGNAGFSLQYQGHVKTWVFIMPYREAPDSPVYWVAPTSPAVAGTWTHVAATYDGASKMITMYVNGVQVGTPVKRETPWHAKGLLQIGSGFPGAVDEIQLYDRVLGPAEVRAVVSRDNVQAGHWKFDEKEGTTAGNSVDGGDAAMLRDGAAFTDKGAVNRAVQLDGGNDHVVTTRPAVRTDQSFSVAAWVWADRFVPSGSAMTAVSQDGNRNSGFYLQYTGNRWVFLKESNDTDTPAWIAAFASQAPVAGTWVHLAGTYNAADGKMTIYVNGNHGGETTHQGPAWDASGPLTIGRAKFAGQFTDYWPGAIDEVRMYNRVLSPQELEGIVSRNDVPAASWKLDGNGTDDGSSRRHGTLVANQAWTSGQATHPDPADLALNLDGADDFMKVSPVVDTAQSYSVSAWVRLGQKKAGWHAVATQAGSDAVAFTLGYSGTDGSNGPADRWAFQINGSNVLNPLNTRVSSGTPAQTGVWTHLAAVYQSGTGEMWLYVNGVQSGYGKLNAQSTFNAQAEFDIGRSMWNRNYGNYFVGAIDDVKVHSRPLFADEVRLMAGRDLTLVHNWRLDEPGGTRAQDAIGGREATLTAGARYDTGRAGNGIRVDGVTGAASTTGVDLPTDKSFTVTAWVNLDKPAPCPGECQVTAVSVDGGQGGTASKFRLGHRIDRDQATGDGKWIFDMPEPDGSITKAAISVQPGQFNTWVFLVGVYDEPAGQIWLYVYSGDPEPDFDSGALQTPWNSTGPLRIGRDQRTTGFWRGSLDDVRLYRGDLDPNRLGALFRSYPASAPAPVLPEADAGHWKFDDNKGTTAVDSSGREQTATLHGGAGWNPGGRIGTTSWLDGINGFAETTATTLNNTEQGFSVSAWVYQTRSTGGKRTVIAQDAGPTSAFLLQYHESDNKYVLEIPGTNPVLVKSEEPAYLGLWVHLAMTYDRLAGQVRLYVNGMAPTVVPVTIPKSAGPLTFGRGKRNNANVEFFPGAVDDVRAFSRPLTDGEVRRVHDDAPEVLHGYWGFEGTANDTSWRGVPTTRSGSTSFGPGVRGQALQLDGSTGSVSTQFAATNMVDTFTVSAWARLSSTAHDATVVAQDGTRMSGFLLQYNKQRDRWIFGAPRQDADFSELAYAESPQPPALNVWTHLTGVYDRPAGQLRLYVNGELVRTADTPLWPAWSAFTIGRGKQNGEPAGFFPGSLDEVHTHLAILPDSEIKRLFGHPVPAGGQLNRFVNYAGEHYTANSTAGHTEPFGPIPPGYHLERPLGKLLPSQVPDTRMLYACKSGTDEFTSTEQNCGGSPATKLADLGWAYTQPQLGVPTVAVYRCATTGSERFDSLDPNCEGNGNTQQQLLGYTVAYAALTRYANRQDWEHTTTVNGVPPGYTSEGLTGLLVMSEVPGTQTLWSCRIPLGDYDKTGLDEFATTDATCAGGTKVASLGRLWTEPPTGAPSRPIYLCQTTGGERFNSIRANCEDAGSTPAVQLGHVAMDVPVPAPAE